jgi:hypothetical protein
VNRLGSANKTDVKKWFKIIAIGSGLIGFVVIMFTFFKGTVSKMKGFFGLGDDAIAGQSGMDSTTLGSAMNTFTGNTAGTSGGGGTSGTSGGTSNVGKPWRPIVDKIYEKLNGANVMMYPEIVNKLAHIPKQQVKYAAYYWNSTYMSGAKKSLYYFIANEWGSNDWLSGHYAPALGALNKAGVGGKK